ncbi:MAG TPA: ribbon-helix-helix protein, CopG family [Spirochaetia bacterium]|nr:ribbon-helix-helix protein, CopG family [Spirochaetia bacterium]
MRRTQIYLDEEIFSILEQESKTKHITVSEVIRRSLKQSLVRREQKILKNLERVFGLWSDRSIDTEQYVRDLRKDREVW